MYSPEDVDKVMTKAAQAVWMFALITLLIGIALGKGCL
jgi:hypothetical protein